MFVVWGILGLSFLVFFHELGHFVAAHLFGVKVEAFSVGMGPVLLHHTHKGTDYRLSLIPIGGYCAMKGEQDYQRALDSDSPFIEAELDSFYGVHPIKRALIGFAGPFFNLLFAFLAFTVIALTGYTYYSAGTTVSMADEVFENGFSAAHEAGLMSGDTIRALDGNEIEAFNDIGTYVSLHGDKPIVITVERDGKLLDFTVTPYFSKEDAAYLLGVVADSNSVVAHTVKGKNIFSAIAEGLRRTGTFLTVTVKSVAILFKGIDLTSTVSGPVRITTMLGSAVSEGFSEGVQTGIVSTLEWLSLISVSLFFTNLLPIPVLDGALILFALLECVTRRKMPPKVLYYIQIVGIVIIGMLFAFVLFCDIKSFIH